MRKLASVFYLSLELEPLPEDPLEPLPLEPLLLLPGVVELLLPPWLPDPELDPLCPLEPELELPWLPLPEVDSPGLPVDEPEETRTWF